MLSWSCLHHSVVDFALLTHSGQTASFGCCPYMQSVVLSGGYEDDKDEGEWFLYTGSGGRDLSGNKRTNKVGGERPCVQGFRMRTCVS